MGTIRGGVPGIAEWPPATGAARHGIGRPAAN
jgi:hypothetical protein